MEAVDNRSVLDVVMRPKSGKALEIKTCNAFNCTPLRVQVFEA